jgi:hypothetical protein
MPFLSFFERRFSFEGFTKDTQNLFALFNYRVHKQRVKGKE